MSVARAGGASQPPASRLAAVWRISARSLADALPKGLFARSLLIVILPVVLLQGAVAYVFLQRNWEVITHRMSSAVARDIGAMVDLYGQNLVPVDDPQLKMIARDRFLFDIQSLPAGPLPPRLSHSFFDTLDPLSRALPSEIASQIRQPFWVDTVGKSGLMEIRVDLGSRVLKFTTRRSLAYEPNVHIFILWMVAASAALLSVAIVFLRNQIRPILRLAAAAEDFGKGRDLDFRPHGAREVRRAGYAFIEMKRRVERAAEQRTAMLNGVSHDLRTILTRFRLSLELMEGAAEADFLRGDVEEMQSMLEAYLAFARGDGGEPTSEIDLRGLFDELKTDAERHGALVSVDARGDMMAKIRPLALKRCLGNLTGNARRYAKRISIQAFREQRFVVVNVDDDGPGIPVESREDVFRPFFRLDESRNQDEGSSGLGLAIARDIARSHGGDVALGVSPWGGLRASLRLPV